MPAHDTTKRVAKRAQRAVQGGTGRHREADEEHSACVEYSREPGNESSTRRQRV